MTPAILAPEGIVVGVVSAAAPRAAIITAIQAAGASVEPCTDTNLLGKAGVIDVIVFDVADDRARFVVPAVALGTDPRTRWIPRIVIVPGDTPVEYVAPFGPAALVLSSTASAETLAAAIADVVERVRARLALERRIRAAEEELRATEERLRTLQQDGATLSHDARVLFGVIVGFAGNLRDGIAGPVSELQRKHATNIVEASTGASSLVDRHVASLRTLTPNSPTVAPRELEPHLRRRQHDLGELVRPIVALFDGIASAKRIRLTAVSERALPTWCDSMQIKQALVNVIGNALKFTPAGGSVEVETRMGPPASSRGGSTDRRDVEIVVSDTGPGIPADQRTRVFERGVRLERDRSRPGSGIGLAVVLDVVALHGGTVRVEDAPSGGASFVLRFPSDLRPRASERAPAAGTGSVRPPRSVSPAGRE